MPHLFPCLHTVTLRFTPPPDRATGSSSGKRQADDDDVDEPQVIIKRLRAESVTAQELLAALAEARNDEVRREAALQDAARREEALQDAVRRGEAALQDASAFKAGEP